MSTIRISKVLSELNIGLDTAIDFLASQKQEVEHNRNAKIDQAQYQMLTQQFATDKSSKDKAETLIQQKREEKEAIQAERELTKPEVIRATALADSNLPERLTWRPTSAAIKCLPRPRRQHPRLRPKNLRQQQLQPLKSLSLPKRQPSLKRQKQPARVYQKAQVNQLHLLPLLRRPNPRPSRLIPQLLKAPRLLRQTN